MINAPEISYSDDELAQRRQVRILVLLNAAANVGLEPVSLPLLHTLAYLSNALAPVWDLDPFDGVVLKRRGSPYYPSLQWNVDRLVGRGLLKVSDLSYVEDNGQCRIDASYCLNPTFAQPVLDSVRTVGFEPGLSDFCDTLAQAVAALPPDQVERMLGEDAGYGNPAVDVSNVVNLAERHGVNFPSNAAYSFRPDVALTAGERVHMYVGHLHTRLARHGS